jgi:hypothetical protein
MPLDAKLIVWYCDFCTFFCFVYGTLLSTVASTVPVTVQYPYHVKTRGNVRYQYLCYYKFSKVQTHKYGTGTSLEKLKVYIKLVNDLFSCM